ncbi:hypothetical protein UZ207_24660, partial [Escherichia coli]|nr:hypothetical protein [Escherichia coli]
FSTGVDLNGNNNSVTLAAKDLKVVGQKATGINVSGDGNTVNMNGGLELIGEKNALADGSQVASLRTGYSYTSVIVV